MRQGRIDICWFSGTGNTLKAAEVLGKAFRQAGREVRFVPMTAPAPSAKELGEVVGLAFPVACQGSYPPVWDFCRALPRGEGREAFLLDTLAQYSGGIVGPLGKLMRAKGYRTVGAREIRMPNNFMPKPLSADELGKKISAGEQAARDYAGELLADGASWGAGMPCISWLWGRISRQKLTWRLMARLGKRFGVVADRCVRCGQCVELCPVGNIVLEDVPVFGKTCIQCQRCVMLCPAGAITVKGKEPLRYRVVSGSEMLARERQGGPEPAA